MAKQPPAWIDASYLQKILQNAVKDRSIEVSDVTVKPATATGDNYSSEMHRVAVEFSRAQDGHVMEETKSLIVKVAPMGDAREEMATEYFATELSMMSITLPRMSKILENVSPTSISAECLWTQYNQPIHIILEDLSPRGFRMADRQGGMDLDHCLLALRNLGKFHAASVAIKEQDSQVFSKYKRALFHIDNHSKMIDIFNLGGKQVTNVIATWPELSSGIKEKLCNFHETLYEKGCKACRYRGDDFNVLNHGDFWINNMLFRYDDEQRPIDHIFVDFQFSHYGSPAVDLLYFFGTSPNNEIRMIHRELLLREYYHSLTNTMAKLECSTRAPSFEDLQETLKNRAFCEIVAAMVILPIVVLEKGEVIDINGLASAEGGYVNPAYHGKIFRKVMTELLPWYDSMGFLDA